MTKRERRYLRVMLRRRDGNHCHWCKKQLRFRVGKSHTTGLPFSISCYDDWATIEHLKPISEGGTDDPNNLTLACRKCNTSRASWSA